MVRLLETNPELRSALSDASRTTQDRSALLTGLLGSQVLPATSTLVAQAITSGKGNVEKVLGDYQRVAAAAQDEILAVVRTARELGEAELRRLSKALGGRDLLDELVTPALHELGDSIEHLAAVHRGLARPAWDRLASGTHGITHVLARGAAGVGQGAGPRDGGRSTWWGRRSEPSSRCCPPCPKARDPACSP